MAKVRRDLKRSDIQAQAVTCGHLFIPSPPPLRLLVCISDLLQGIEEQRRIPFQSAGGNSSSKTFFTASSTPPTRFGHNEIEQLVKKVRLSTGKKLPEKDDAVDH